MAREGHKLEGVSARDEAPMLEVGRALPWAPAASSTVVLVVVWSQGSSAPALDAVAVAGAVAVVAAAAFGSSNVQGVHTVWGPGLRKWWEAGYAAGAGADAGAVSVSTASQDTWPQFPGRRGWCSIAGSGQWPFVDTGSL